MIKISGSGGKVSYSQFKNMMLSRWIRKKQKFKKSLLS
jgi:hypothetical protein